MNPDQLNAVARDLVYMDAIEGYIPRAEEVGYWVRPDASPYIARCIGRVIAVRLGEVFKGATTPYEEAMAIGIPKEVFLGWLRDKTEAICAGL